jgi:hypothetical protein
LIDRISLNFKEIGVIIIIMKLKDFKIGKTFYTASGEWMTVDVGTRTVIAYNISKQPDRATEWDLQDNEVFYEYDFGGCRLENSFPTFKK